MKIQDINNTTGGLQPTKIEVAEFLDTIALGTISTISEDGKPQVATVAFSQTEELELVVGTDDKSRKAQNINSNPNVAFVATDPEQRITVQFEGVARILSKEEFDNSYAKNHFRKLPASLPFKDIPGQVYFVLEPRYLKFSDCKPFPWVVTGFTW